MRLTCSRGKQTGIYERKRERERAFITRQMKRRGRKEGGREG